MNVSLENGLAMVSQENPVVNFRSFLLQVTSTIGTHSLPWRTLFYHVR